MSPTPNIRGCALKPSAARLFEGFISFPRTINRHFSAAAAASSASAHPISIITAADPCPGRSSGSRAAAIWLFSEVTNLRRAGNLPQSPPAIPTRTAPERGGDR